MSFDAIFAIVAVITAAAIIIVSVKQLRSKVSQTGLDLFEIWFQSKLQKGEALPKDRAILFEAFREGYESGVEIKKIIRGVNK